MSAHAPVLMSEWARSRLGIARLGNDAALAYRFSLLFEAQARQGEAEAAFARRLLNAEPGSALWSTAADCLPNHETSFFRDGEQLRAFVTRLVPALRERCETGQPLRVLSVGCATGEEVYSLAMLVLDSLHVLWGEPIQFLGIDVSPSAIARAQQGAYSTATAERAGEGPRRWAHRFFRSEGGALLARPWLRAPTHFEVANLFDSQALESLGCFDAVLCRNVLIYFGNEAIDSALPALWARVRVGGALLLGRAEAGLGARLAGARTCAGEPWFVREVAS